MQTQARPPHIVSPLGQVLLHQTLLELRAPQTTTAYLAIQLKFHNCLLNFRLLNHQGAHLPCFHLHVFRPPPPPHFTACRHPLRYSHSLLRSLRIFYRLYSLCSFYLKLLQDQGTSQYSYRDQIQFFRDALDLPMSSGVGDFVPQQMYRPHTNSDRRRYVEEVHLEQPIYFWMENPVECGIPLIDALQSRVRRLQNRDETVFAGRGPSISVRIQVSDNLTWFLGTLGPHGYC